jgi:hypothetical protein
MVYYEFITRKGPKNYSIKTFPKWGSLRVRRVRRKMKVSSKERLRWSLNRLRDS